jgi:hypothetical protein
MKADSVLDLLIVKFDHGFGSVHPNYKLDLFIDCINPSIMPCSWREGGECLGSIQTFDQMI